MDGVASLGQEMLWAIEQSGRAGASNSCVFAVRFQGLCDAPRIARALESVLESCESLRSTFELRDGRLVRDVRSSVHLEMTTSSAAALPEHAECMPDQVRDTVMRPIDVAVGPLARFHLVTTPLDSLLYVVVHHMVFDGSSQTAFLHALVAALAGRQVVAPSASAERPPAPRPSVGTFAPVTLPITGPFAADGGPAVHSARVRLEHDLIALDRARARLGASRFAVLAASLVSVLRRYGNHDRMSLGLAVSLRRRVDRRSVGMFIRTLPLEVELPERPTVESVVDRVSDGVARCLLGEVRPVVGTEPSPNRGRSVSAFDVLVSHYAVDAAQHQVGSGLARLEDTLPSIDPKAPLVVFFIERAGGVDCLVECDAALFDPGAPQRIASHIDRMLDAVVGPTVLPADDVDIVGPVEKAAVRRWSAGEAVRIPTGTVDELFEDVVAKDPSRPAVVCGADTVTYGELDRWADGIAGAIAGSARPLGRETRIAILMPASAGRIAAMLGVLKAGCTYVPLDVSHPPGRNQTVTELSGARLVLVAEERDEIFGLPALSVEPARSGAPGAHRRPHAQELAYVGFTSGSTGEPKGVMVAHRSIVNLVRSTSFIDLGAARRVLHAAPIAFDAATFEVWGALLHGATCVVLTEEDPSLDQFERVLLDGEVDTAWLTASMFNALLDDRPRALHALTNLIVGGEQLSTSHVETALSTLPATSLVNGYGPTETTTFATTHPVMASDVLATVPIGRPLANVQVHVLDEALQPVAMGVEGDLYIGGAGVARGYLDDRQLTAARFVPDPFGPVGGRLYRSGDRACWVPPGVLRFRGRNDLQVKIRGHRVEPGEVEQVLQREPRVRMAAVVVVLRSEDGAPALEAFVAGERLDADELRTAIARRLPRAMVPQRIHLVDALPRTKSGKVDRRALRERMLPVPRRAGRESGRPLKGDVERVLGEAWQDLLGVDAVTATSDFLELGGDSLLAARVAARLHGRIGVELRAADILAHPVLADLGRIVEHQVGAAPGPPPLPTSGGPYPLSPWQQRLWTLEALAPGSSINVVPAAVRFRGDLDLDRLEAALVSVVAQHDALRLRFSDEGGVARQVVDERAVPGLAVVDLSRLSTTGAATEAAERAAADIRVGLDVAVAPQVRATAITLPAGESLLVLPVHHLVCDGWGLRLLLDALADHYRGATTAEPRPTVPSYMGRLQARAEEQTGAARERGIDYWTQQLASVPEVALPGIRQRSLDLEAVTTHRTSSLAWRELSASARSLSATPFVVLSSALHVALVALTGGYDTPIGVPAANRTTEDEEVVGMFANEVVVRISSVPELTFEQLVDRARRATVGALRHQETPFDAVVQAIDPCRELGKNPLYQVLFQVDEQPPLASFGALEATRCWIDVPAARADIDLEARRHSGALLLAATYRTGLYDEASVQELLSAMDAVVSRAAKEPGLTVAALSGMEAGP